MYIYIHTFNIRNIKIAFATLIAFTCKITHCQCLIVFIYLTETEAFIYLATEYFGFETT